MSEKVTRRGALRGAAALVLGGAAFHLVRKADGQIVWNVDAARCINSRLGEPGVEVCGRCNVCPAYFNITSAVNEKGLPSEKLCPRDAIARKPIGEIDPQDPANNFYEYVIDEVKCDGCGKCVMACKEPLGLGSIVLRVRHNLCVGCNRCAISTACPKDAIQQVPIQRVFDHVQLGSHT
jgi:electron transport complex protein RnfB